MCTRAELQKRAEGVILSAQVLLAPGVGRWTDAYNLVGYAVEFGLKSCILVRLTAHPELFFTEKTFQRDAWTHDSETLLKLAQLRAVRDADAGANPALYKNWQAVKDWNVDARYLEWTQADAERLFEAITHPADGVMPWIRRHW